MKVVGTSLLLLGTLAYSASASDFVETIAAENLVASKAADNLSARFEVTSRPALFNTALRPAKSINTDRSLVQALRQETMNSESTDLDSLVWLSSMSEQLERRIPNPFYRIRLLKAVFNEANRQGLDPQLVLAVIDIESNFNRYAQSSAGAQGLMQVMPFWKDVYEQPDDDLFHPVTSLRYGCAILRHYIDKHGNLKQALAAYNGSLGRSTYPNKVLKRLKRDWQFEADDYSTSSETGIASR